MLKCCSGTDCWGRSLQGRPSGLAATAALSSCPTCAIPPSPSRQPPMLVDPIDNPFDAAFAPWPLRFYILHRGRIAYKAQARTLVV